MTDANAGLGGAFDMKLLCAGKSLYKSKPVGVACVCERERERERERDGRGLKTSQQRTDYFNKDCAVLSRSVIQLFATPWTIATPPQAPLSMWILQAGILEWVVISFSGRSSQPRD